MAVTAKQDIHTGVEWPAQILEHRVVLDNEQFDQRHFADVLIEIQRSKGALRLYGINNFVRVRGLLNNRNFILDFAKVCNFNLCFANDFVDSGGLRGDATFQLAGKPKNLHGGICRDTALRLIRSICRVSIERMKTRSSLSQQRLWEIRAGLNLQTHFGLLKATALHLKLARQDTGASTCARSTLHISISRPVLGLR